MPALLYGIGALTLFAGLLMIGFGIPINEFSFGNTLIMAGTTASVGGSDHHWTRRGRRTAAAGRRDDGYAAIRPAGAGARGAGKCGAPPRPTPAQGGPPFPVRPASPALDPMPGLGAHPYDDNFEEVATPTLRNPDIPEALEEEISLSPPRPAASAVRPPANDLSAFGRPTPVPSPAVAATLAEKREPMVGWRSPSAPPAHPARPAHGANFDAMWPAEAKPKGPAVREPQPDAKVESISRDPKRGEPDAQAPHGRGPEVGCRRRDGLYALRRRID